LYLVVGLWATFGLEKKSRAGSRMGYWCMPVLIIFLTGVWYRYAKSAPVQFMPFDHQEQVQNLLFVAQPHFWSKLFISRFPELCSTYAGLLLGIVGAWRLRRVSSWLFFSGWFLSTCVYTVMLGRYGYIHQYTSLPFTPIVAVFAACGLVYFWEQSAHRFGLRIATLLLAIAIPVHTVLRIAHWYRPDNQWLFKARDVLATVARPEDLILVNTGEPPVFLYYLDHYGYAVNLESTGAIEPRMAGVRFLVTPVENGWADHPFWKKFLAEHHRRIYQDPEFQIYSLS
jgi:hypothetical protein